VIATSITVDLTGFNATARALFDAETLHGVLLLRLTEEGYAIRPAPASATYRLALRADSRQLTVVVNDHESGKRVALGPSLSLVHLEAAQRSVATLAEVPAGDAMVDAKLTPIFVQLDARDGAVETTWLHGISG
jgi:hypothetical protein